MLTERVESEPANSAAPSFVAELRHVLPALTCDAEQQLADPRVLARAFRRRAQIISVPDQSIDGIVLFPPEARVRQLGHEALFSYLLIAVFCASLRQGLDASCSRDDITACIPELAAYDWFSPSQEVAQAVDEVLNHCHLWPIPMDVASDVYQGSLTRDEKKALGQYYTPPALVEHLLDTAAYAPGKGIADRLLLDVAIGFGVFLAGAARRLIRDLDASHRPLDDIVTTLGHALRGYDLQPFAVIATKLHILAVLIDEMRLDGAGVAQVLATLHLPHVRAADTLAAPEDQAADAPHIVVGNPPYGACAHGLHLAPFKDVVGGRANLYQLFMYKSLRLCRDGGTVALLVPESMRAGQFFLKLRRYLVETTELLCLTDFHARTSIFDGVEQGVLILSMRKGRSLSTGKVKSVAVAQVATAAALVSARTFSVPWTHVQAGNEMAHALIKANDPATYALLYRLRTTSLCHKRLSLKVHTGPLVWNRVVTDLGPTPEPGMRPVIYAQSVHRYAFDFPPYIGRLSCVERLYARPSEALARLAMDCPAIVLQRTTAREQLQRLIATMVSADFLRDYPTYYVENHVNFIAGATCDGHAIPLTYVLALLNSRLLNFVFATSNGSTQVSAYELGLLPLLYNPDSGLDSLVVTRLSAGGDEVATTEREIDRRVYDLYGLTADERRIVDDYHTRYHSGAGRLIVRGT